MNVQLLKILLIAAMFIAVFLIAAMLITLRRISRRLALVKKSLEISVESMSPQTTADGGGDSKHERQ